MLFTKGPNAKSKVFPKLLHHKCKPALQRGKMIDFCTQESARCNGSYLMKQVTCILLKIHAVFWPFSPPKCVHPKDCSYQLDVFLFAVQFVSIYTTLCTKNRNLLQFLKYLEHQRTPWPCPPACTSSLFTHDSLSSQLWGRNCEGRGQHWPLTLLISQTTIHFWSVCGSRLWMEGFHLFISSPLKCHSWVTHSCETATKPVVCNNHSWHFIQDKKTIFSLHCEGFNHFSGATANQQGM